MSAFVVDTEIEKHETRFFMQKYAVYWPEGYSSSISSILVGSMSKFRFMRGIPSHG